MAVVVSTARPIKPTVLDSWLGLENSHKFPPFEWALVYLDSYW